MMRILRIVMMLAVALGLSACAPKPKSKFLKYDGPEVTQVQVHKADRKMYLLHEGTVLKSFDVSLGFTPEGHKQFEGDGKTPEGGYLITHRNPNSAFHLSLGISYPNEQDREFAKSAGKEPGGNIFIHGGPRRPTDKRDWTEGCIAVTDEEIEIIYSMVKPGTTIYILP